MLLRFSTKKEKKWTQQNWTEQKEIKQTEKGESDIESARIFYYMLAHSTVNWEI